MSANGCSTSTGNIANNEFGNKNISGSIILKSKNNSQKKSANTIIKAHDNVAENEGYKMILPSTKGTAEQVLKIDSVTNDLLNLSWGEGGGGGGGDITVQDEGSSLATAATTLNFTGENVTASGTGATKTINITSDTYSQYSLETGQFSLLSGLTFDSGGGDFSKFFSNSNLNNEFVRFSVSSYPKSFTWTPHSNEVNYPLTKVVMWTRDTNAVNDTEMFPTQFKIYGRPTAGSSTGETEIGNIILSSQPSRSENLLISSAAVNSVINTNKVVYSQYRIEIYENNSSGFSKKPLIGELRFYRPSSVQQYGNELTNWTENGAGHIIPSEDSLYDIGSAEKKVRHLYLSSNSLNIGDVVLSSENDDIKIGDNKLVKVTSEPIDGQGLVYSSNQWIPGPSSIPMARFKFEQNTSHYNYHTVLLMANNTERKIAFSLEHNSLNLTKDSSHNFYLPPGKYIITAQIVYRMAQYASSVVDFKLNKGTSQILHAFEYYHYKQRFNFYQNQHDYDAGFAHATISGLIESTSVNDAYNFTVFYDSNSTNDGTIAYAGYTSERQLGWIIKVE